MAEREAEFAGKPYAEQDDSRCGNGCLLDGALFGRLDYLMRGVAYCAVRMRQAIRMKVGLLNRGADEEKNGADDRKQNLSAHFGRAILPHTSHWYRIQHASHGCDYLQNHQEYFGQPESEASKCIGFRTSDTPDASRAAEREIDSLPRAHRNFHALQFGILQSVNFNQ